MDWQEGLDAYLAWTDAQRLLDEMTVQAQDLITLGRARALAAMAADGKSVRRIAWLTRLSPARVGQLLAVANTDEAARAGAEAQPAESPADAPA